MGPLAEGGRGAATSPQVAAALEAGDAGDVLAALDTFVSSYRNTLLDSDFEAGCPVAAAAMVPDTRRSRRAGETFSLWESAIADQLIGAGLGTGAARRLSVHCIAAIEGALILCRAQRTIAPLDTVASELRGLLSLRIG